MQAKETKENDNRSIASPTHDIRCYKNDIKSDKTFDIQNCEDKRY